MATQYTKIFTTEFSSSLIDALIADVNIAPNLRQIIDLGDGNSIFEYESDLSGTEEAYLDAFLLSWQAPTAIVQAEINFVAEIAELVNTVGPVGTMYNLRFSYKNKAKNRWLNHNPDEPSDSIPAIVPWPSRLTALSISTSDDNADADVQVYINSVLEYTWVLRNIRAATQSILPSQIDLNIGDKISIYVKDRGTDLQEPMMVIYCQVLDQGTSGWIDNTKPTNNDDDD